MFSSPTENATPEKASRRRRVRKSNKAKMAHFMKVEGDPGLDLCRGTSWAAASWKCSEEAGKEFS